MANYIHSKRINSKLSQERRYTPKHYRLPKSVYVQRVETVKQSGPWICLGKWNSLVLIMHDVYYSSGQMINWNRNSVKLYFSSIFGNPT